MIGFREVTIEDKDWISKLMQKTHYMGSDYTFSNLFNWSAAFTACIARIDDYLIVRSGKTNFRYMVPIGCGDIAVALNAVEAHVKINKDKLLYYGIGREAKEIIENTFPGKYMFNPVRDNFDYIYEREKLAALSGKRYHGKRNHIARFKQNNPNWKYETIDESNIESAIEMNIEWCKRRGCDHSSDLKRESCAVMSGFKHYFQLGLTGGLLRKDGQVIAFTYGSPVRDDTFVVHVEKAYAEIQGAYPMINQLFVENELSGYQYVNREDDLGDEGLRRAKESYRPAFLYERFEAVLYEES
jgi:hypothetical protein